MAHTDSFSAYCGVYVGVGVSCGMTVRGEGGGGHLSQNKGAETGSV